MKNHSQMIRKKTKTLPHCFQMKKTHFRMKKTHFRMKKKIQMSFRMKKSDWTIRSCSPMKRKLPTPGPTLLTTNLKNLHLPKKHCSELNYPYRLYLLHHCCPLKLLRLSQYLFCYCFQPYRCYPSYYPCPSCRCYLLRHPSLQLMPPSAAPIAG